MHHVTQLAIFPVLLFAYIGALKYILLSPVYLFSVCFGIWLHKKGKKISPRANAYFMRFEIFFGIASALLFLLFYILNIFPEHIETMFWKNPAVVATALAFSTFVATAARSFNPLERAQGAPAPFHAFAILLSVILLTYFEQAVHLSTMRYALFIAVLLLIIPNIYQLFVGPRRMREFGILSARHDELLASLQPLQRTAFFVGDPRDRKALDDAIAESRQKYEDAFDALRRSEFEKAEAAILQAETEIAYIERIINTRLQLSMPDELERQLKQAEADLQELHSDFKTSGLAPSLLDDLDLRLKELIIKLANLADDDKRTIENLEEYQKFFRQIVDVKTALRFRRNVDDVIRTMKADVEEKAHTLNVVRELGIHALSLADCHKRLQDEIVNFETGPIKNASELVGMYQTIQRLKSMYDSGFSEVKARVDRSWSYQELSGGSLYAVVPKICSTTNAAVGAIVVGYSKLLDQKITAELTGTLLDDVPPEITIDLNQTIRIFTFAGKRGGKGKLHLRIKDQHGRGPDVTFDIYVTESIAQTAQNAFLLGAAVGGVAGLMFWWDGQDVDVAGPLAGLAGAVFFVAAFLWRLLRLRMQ